MDLTQIASLIVQPVLVAMAKCEPALAEGCSLPLVLGTGNVETGFNYVAQIQGPALGPWQIEDLTFNDMMARVVPSIKGMQDVIDGLCLAGCTAGQDYSSLPGNWYLGAAICRLKYWSDPAPLPGPATAVALATLHKGWYNTSGGAAVIATNVPLFQAAIDAVASLPASNGTVTI